MKNLTYLFLVFLFVTTLTSCTKVGQIHGTVKDSKTGDLIENAKVEISPGDMSSILTNSTGEFNFPDLTEGLYTISVSKEGYITSSKDFNVTKGETVQSDFSLQPKADEIPEITTGSITEITNNSAKATGNIINLGSETIINYGHCWNTSPDPTTANNKTAKGSITVTGEYSSNLTGLEVKTTYYVRAYVTNSKGTFYGAEESFTTLVNSTTPTVTTTTVTNITQTTATAGGNVTSDGGATIIQRGVCYSTSQNPTTSNSIVTTTGTTGSFICNLSGLSENTTYYVRAYAINSQGTSYGTQVSFKTDVSTSVTDIDGNIYSVVVIGNQIWMAEDLRVTHYPNGTAIPNVTDNSDWANLGDNNTDDAYCFYDNNSSSDYGTFYTYAAAIGDNWANDNATGQGVCPDGWHLPTDAEWAELIYYLGGSSVAGGKMKETGTTHWHSPNTGATNESDFTALPCGYRIDYDGRFFDFGYSERLWSATEINATQAWYRYLNYDDGEVSSINDNKSDGYSVRCIRDN